MAKAKVKDFLAILGGIRIVGGEDRSMNRYRSAQMSNKLYYHYKYYVNNRSRDLAKEEEEGRFKNTVLSSIDIIWLYVYLLSRD